jgi:hypothetical protein
MHPLALSGISGDAKRIWQVKEGKETEAVDVRQAINALLECRAHASLSGVAPVKSY